MKSQNPTTATPLRIVAFGAGNRMNKYLHYILDNPSRARLVAVVDPNPLRRNKMADLADIPLHCRFVSGTDFFNSSIDADAAFICSPEEKHYPHAMQAISRGLHVLLEKPVAQSLRQCVEIADAGRAKGVRVGVCHVLRHHPYYEKMHRLVSSGSLGQVISISHRTCVGIDRATHSFVRGALSRQRITNPMLITKCCHDIDFLLWLAGEKAEKISSMGGRRWFRSENAPLGSSKRCIDCSIESSCPYSAVDLYRNRRKWIDNFDIPAGMTIDTVIEHELHNGDYGRCVFHCDNDVVDRQTLSLETTSGIVINLSMDLFTPGDLRETRICMTEGEICGNELSITVNRLRPRKQETFDFSSTLHAPLHAGADIKIVARFIDAINHPDLPLLTDISEAIESHRICFEAESHIKSPSNT